MTHPANVVDLSASLRSSAASQPSCTPACATLVDASTFTLSYWPAEKLPAANEATVKAYDPATIPELLNIITTLQQENHVHQQNTARDSAIISELRISEDILQRKITKLTAESEILRKLNQALASENRLLTNIPEGTERKVLNTFELLEAAGRESEGRRLHCKQQEAEEERELIEHMESWAHLSDEVELTRKRFAKQRLERGIRGEENLKLEGMAAFWPEPESCGLESDSQGEAYAVDNEQEEASEGSADAGLVYRDIDDGREEASN